MSTGLQALRERFPQRCRQEAPLRDFTSWRIGGPAELLFEPESRDELQQALGLIGPEQPVHLLGKGSNLLIDDAGLRGLVIRLGQAFGYTRVDGTRFTCGGAAAATTVCRSAAAAGLAGLEFMTGIPATIGGMVRMNAGAHGSETADHLFDVELVDRSGRVTRRAAADLKLEYRRAAGLNSGEIVTEASFELVPGSVVDIQARLREYQDYRRRTQPLREASCGSVFRRPHGHYPGKLIEDAGLKGMRVGAAEVSELHANFIINTGSASSRDILELVALIKQRVLEQSGVELVEEFHHVH